MLKINKIIIENFRGIKHPLELEFKKGGKFTSIGLYGRNGTGKSSITDSWEWLQSGKISHLSRENSSERDYPNRYTGEGSSYISVEFEGPISGTVKLEVDSKKVTMPKEEGDHEIFKSYAKYPCYLRYRDLQQFVYNTKAEKYNYLAKYLGLEIPLKFQVEMFAYTKVLTINYNNNKKVYGELCVQIITLLDGKSITLENVLAEVAIICVRHDIEIPKSAINLRSSVERLQEIIDNNPANAELKQWGEVKKILAQYSELKDLTELLILIEASYTKLKSDESVVSKLVLSDLYDSALSIVSNRVAVDEVDICPVCDNNFDGNLLHHITEKHSELLSFKKIKNEYENLCSRVTAGLINFINSCKSLCEGDFNFVRAVEKDSFICSDEAIMFALAAQKVFKSKVQDIVDFSLVENARIHLQKFTEHIILFEAKTEEKISQLSKDEVVKSLSQDYDKAKSIHKVYGSLIIAKVGLDKLELANNQIAKVYSDFVDWMQQKMVAAFNVISSDVVTYFNILESTAGHITEPSIKLNTDKDKAVELEVKFNNEIIKPVYKYLSESQINSFGLSVFMASIKNFNPDFKFAILDDIVNSFDAYKRPLIIRLLQLHFSDYQFLVLTHDIIWYEGLLRTFQSWNKLKFESWSLTYGPKVVLGKGIVEQIEDYVSTDNAVVAGQLFGRYLEGSLQDYNFNLQGMLKYKYDNQYVLSELLDAFMARVGKDLKPKHVFYIKLKSFSEDLMFRNYCAHFKSPETEYSSAEIKGILDKWLDIEADMRCVTCNTFVTKADIGFMCHCKLLRLVA